MNLYSRVDQGHKGFKLRIISYNVGHERQQQIV